MRWLGRMMAYLALAIVFGGALWGESLSRSAQAQGYGFSMRASEFNAIAARMGCKTEMVDGDLLPMAFTRVAECLAVRFGTIETRLKTLEQRRK